jgi:GNAT superfamily N-acetyltransferase
MSQQPIIRPTTPDLLQTDLDAGLLLLHPDKLTGLSDQLGNTIDFYVAETDSGEPRGQVGVRWIGPDSEEVREGLQLEKGEVVPNIGFMEVPEASRGQGIGRALLDAVYQETRRRGHHRLFLSVAVGNVAARRFYERNGFADAGFRRMHQQFDQNPDGTYGELVETEMEYMIRDLD